MQNWYYLIKPRGLCTTLGTGGEAKKDQSWISLLIYRRQAQKQNVIDSGKHRNVIVCNLGCTRGEMDTCYILINIIIMITITMITINNVIIGISTWSRISQG